MNSRQKSKTDWKATVSLPRKSRITLKVNCAVKQIEVAPWTTLLDALHGIFTTYKDQVNADPIALIKE